MNIKEIARQAGVSVATVSRVLNHPETVAPKTRERILDLMEQMDYKPNWFARGLNFNKTYTLALLIPNILNPAYVEIAEGVESVANRKGYSVLLCITEGEVEKERQYIQTLIDRHIDGVILVSSLLNGDDINYLKQQGVAVVLVGENNGAYGSHRLLRRRISGRAAFAQLRAQGNRPCLWTYSRYGE